jgi:hypothetical protein
MFIVPLLMTGPSPVWSVLMDILYGRGDDKIEVIRIEVWFDRHD